MTLSNILIDQIGDIADNIASRAYPAGIRSSTILFFDYANQYVWVALAVLALYDEYSHVATDTAGTAGLVIYLGPGWQILNPGIQAISTRQCHKPLDLPGSRELVIPKCIKKAAIIADGCLVAIGTSAPWDIFNQV